MIKWGEPLTVPFALSGSGRFKSLLASTTDFSHGIKLDGCTNVEDRDGGAAAGSGDAGGRRPGNHRWAAVRGIGALRRRLGLRQLRTGTGAPENRASRIAAPRSVRVGSAGGGRDRGGSHPGTDGGIFRRQAARGV